MAVTKYLDKTGLTYLWGKIKAWCNATFALISHTHNAATTSANGFLSSTDKTKLNSLSQYPRFTYTAFNFISNNSGINYINQNSTESILTHLSTTQESVLRFKAYKGLSLTFEQPNIQSDAQYNDFHFVVDGARLAGDGLIGSAGTLSVPEYEGATASANATSGLVPPALKAERSYFLKGDGTWDDLSSKAEDSNVVHKTGDETIGGNKTFSSSVIASATPAIKRSDNTGKLVLVGGSNAQSTSGAKLYLNGSSISETGLVAGGFCLQAGNSSGYKQLNGYPDGQLAWDGPDVTIESNIPRIRLKNTAVDSSITSSTTKFTGSISFTDSASSSTTDFNRRTGAVMSGINNSDANFIRLLAYDPEPNSDTYAGVAVGYPRNGSPYAVAPSTLSTRTNGTDIVTRDWIPNDTRIVHTTGSETIEGEKTFKGHNKSPIHVFRDKSSSGFTAGELAHVFYAEMLSGSTGDVSFGCSPISLIGNDTETAYNVGVRLGSTNGMTLVTAGECGAYFTSATGTYNNENIYLTADGTIRMYVGCSNDATSYAGPVVISGTATSGGTGSTTTITATNFAGNASTATKATQDGNGNIIASTYLPLSGGTMTGNVNFERTATLSGTSTTHNVSLTMNSSSLNFGIYDHTFSKWAWMITPYGNVYFYGNANTATKLNTARTINGVDFDGSANITIEDSTKLPLAGGTLTGNLLLKNATPIIGFLDNDLTKGTNPTATNWSGIYFCDKTGNTNTSTRSGALEVGVNSSGTVSFYMRSYKWAASNTSNVAIAVHYPASGSGYTEAPTPDTDDNSTKIATTAFVKAQGYITSSGTATNVSGTVAIANGGTGATTRLNAIKALVNESVSTNATHFLGMKSDWSKVGYVSVADAKTVLGLGTAAYSSSDTFATASHTHSYLPLSGGNLTGSIKLNTTSTAGIYKGNATSVSEFSGGSALNKGARLALYGESHSSAAGEVDLVAADASTVKHLILLPDGTFTWDGTAVSLSGHTHDYLALSGGTLTGSLTIKRVNPYVYFVETDWEKGGTVSANQYQGIYFQDKNGVTGSSILYHYGSTKTSYLTITANKMAASTDSSNISVNLVYREDDTRSFNPGSTGVILLGRSDMKWKEVWCTQSSLNSTSDERLKNSIDWISENVLDAWEDVNWIQYKYNDASQEKGIEKARIHTGMIAQQIKTVFENNNIDVNKYGFFLYDKWEAKEAEYDKDGNLTTPAKEAGDQYGLRYTEALCIEAAYQRRKNKILENRISELEKQVSDMIILLQNLTNDNG